MGTKIQDMLVDVGISAFGKPYQTKLAVLSLLKHSDKHIGKIYLNIEKHVPFDDDMSVLINIDEKVRLYRPKYFLGDVTPIESIHLEEGRLSIRYQFAWENSDKDYLFIMHNDSLFTGDVIGEMLGAIGDCAGVGGIGQCWNCPAKSAGVCDSTRWEDFKPTYEEAIEIVNKNPSPRTTPEKIDHVNPMPFPECRLNEFVCLINLKKVRFEVMPLGNTIPLGVTDDNHDTGIQWFRSLVLKGYKFKNFGTPSYKHNPFSEGGGKHLCIGKEEDYRAVEAKAKEYINVQLG